MRTADIARSAAVGLLASLLVSCGPNASVQSDPTPETQTISTDPAVAEAYETSLRCLVWFALEYNAVSSAQSAQPAETITLRQGQFDTYRNAVIALGAQLGKSQDTALAEASTRSEARLPDYIAEGNTAYDDDARFCTLDWQQRVIRGDDHPGASNAP